jgi:hypothetical protein
MERESRFPVRTSCFKSTNLLVFIRTNVERRRQHKIDEKKDAKNKLIWIITQNLYL